MNRQIGSEHCSAHSYPLIVPSTMTGQQKKFSSQQNPRQHNLFAPHEVKSDMSAQVSPGSHGSSLQKRWSIISSQQQYCPGAHATPWQQIVLFPTAPMGGWKSEPGGHSGQWGSGQDAPGMPVSMHAYTGGVYSSS